MHVFLNLSNFHQNCPMRFVSLFIFYKGVNQNGVISELFVENKSWDDS